MLDAHRAWLAEPAPEVTYSARILWQELLAQRRFTGSCVIVRRAVPPLHMAASTAALTQRRFETRPGEQAQCGWGQITLPLGGVRTGIHIFVMPLGHSRRVSPPRSWGAPAQTPCRRREAIDQFKRNAIDREDGN